MYMTFDAITKEEVAAMYWGAKKGAYALWVHGNELTKEKFFLDGFTGELRKVGLHEFADGYMKRWQKRADAYVDQVKTLKIA